MNAGWSSRLAMWMFLALAASHAVGAEYGLYFGGPGGAIVLPAAKVPRHADQITVEVRFKTSTRIRQPVRLVSRWSDDPAAKDKGVFRLGLKPWTQIAFSLRDDKGQVRAIAGRGAWQDGKWHHAAGTWDGSVLRVYLDGKVIAASKLTGFGAPGVSGLPLRIGPAAAKRARRPTVFEGFLSDVAVWSTARTIAQVVSKPIAGKEAGLVSHVPLREASPTPVVRDRVSGAEGKLTGAARVGWCVTPMWDEDDRPAVHLFSYDLSAAPKRPATAPDPSGAARQLIVTNDKTNQVGVLWQDRASGAIYVTWVDAGFGHHETIRLKGMPDGILAAGTTDPWGNVYYLEIQKSSRDRDEAVALRANLHRAGPDGKPLAEGRVDMSKAKGAFNVYAYGGRWGGSMAYHQGSLGLILPRTMHRGGDGLRHQGAIAVVLSAHSPSVFRMLGQTSGHSFGNVLTVNSRGEFLGVDLGDNYPRGVHLHKFTRAKRVSRVVFTYKTAHATRPRNGSPVYAEISQQGKTFYKWSNDNATYTELGGAVEGRRSYSVIFSTDRSLAGKVLDNSRAFRNSGDPRDLAMLRVIKDFEKARGGNQVSDSIMAGIGAGSQSETGGFYGFGGRWAPQRVTGVIWLTKYKKNEAAHAPQPLRLRDGNILILWEKTGPHGAGVYAMKVAESGKIVTGPIPLGADLRFNREDRAVAMGNRIFLLAHDTTSGKTKLCFVYDH